MSDNYNYLIMMLITTDRFQKYILHSVIHNKRGAMNNNDTNKSKQHQKYRLIFNIAVMISSFTIALVALPQEMFFVVAVIILFALRDIEKDISKSSKNKFTILPGNK